MGLVWASRSSTPPVLLPDGGQPSRTLSVRSSTVPFLVPAILLRRRRQIVGMETRIGTRRCRQRWNAAWGCSRLTGLTQPRPFADGSREVRGVSRFGLVPMPQQPNGMPGAIFKTSQQIRVTALQCLVVSRGSLHTALTLTQRSAAVCNCSISCVIVVSGLVEKSRSSVINWVNSASACCRQTGKLPSLMARLKTSAIVINNAFSIVMLMLVPSAECASAYLSSTFSIAMERSSSNSALVIFTSQNAPQCSNPPPAYRQAP